VVSVSHVYRHICATDHPADHVYGQVSTYVNPAGRVVSGTKRVYSILLFGQSVARAEVQPVYRCVVYRSPVKCGCADLRIFEVVKCGEILRIYLQMLWVKCGCGNADMPPMNVCLPCKHDKEHLPTKHQQKVVEIT